MPGLTREQAGGWIIGGLGGIAGLKHRPGSAQWNSLSFHRPQEQKRRG